MLENIHPESCHKSLGSWKKEEVEWVWIILEQRLEFLASAIDAYQVHNQLQSHGKLGVLLAEQESIPLLLKFLVIFSASLEVHEGCFEAKLRYLADYCFRIISAGKNNPCAIEQLLMPAEEEYLEKIQEKFPTETWYALFNIFQPHNIQEQVFTMNSSQMLRTGLILIELTTTVENILLVKDGPDFQSQSDV